MIPFSLWLAQINSTPFDRELFEDFLGSPLAPLYFDLGLSISEAIAAFRAGREEGDDSDGAREGNDGWATARVPRERFE